MGRQTFAAVLALGGALLAVPAAAQFGSIFGEPPPRPPGSVPGGRQSFPSVPAQPAPQLPPPGNYPPPAPGGPYGGIQSQPLAPPPPGSAAVDPSSRIPPAQPPVTGLPPGQRPQRQPPEASQPAEAVAEPPSQKIINSAALFSGLDKITGRIINFDVTIGETVQFGALQLTPRACYTRPATETSNTDAFVEVDEVTLQGEVRRIFTGWMYAASPGLHAVEHPIYDIWLTDCKGGAQAVAAEKPAEAPAPARQPQRAQPKQAPRQPVQQQPPLFR
jgi:hypothetical protein